MSISLRHRLYRLQFRVDSMPEAIIDTVAEGPAVKLKLQVLPGAAFRPRATIVALLVGSTVAISMEIHHTNLRLQSRQPTCCSASTDADVQNMRLDACSSSCEPRTGSI